MPFTTPVHLNAPVHEGGRWTTVEAINFQSTHFTYPGGKPKNYIVPAGYETDLASVPRWPLVYWFVGGRGTVAAITHDWNYEFGMRLKQIASRQEADDLYREMLVEMGVSALVAKSMWLGVRMAGGSHFTDHTRPIDTDTTFVG